MIVFLIDTITPRWEYTFDFIFGIRGIEYQLMKDETEFSASAHPKFRIPEKMGALLRTDEVKLTLVDEDLLSRLFFVLTRMEEYEANSLDEHGRFSGKQSWQFKNDCLQLCVCDRWAIEFIVFLEKELIIALKRKQPVVEIIPTFDIDNAFAYKHKKGVRKVLSSAKDLMTSNTERIKERVAVLSGKERDPYDGFGKIETIAKDYSVRLFWLVGDYGKPDYNISIETPEIGSLINQLNGSMHLGIHPSYRSNSKASLLLKEIVSLESVLEENIRISRQHFLKLHLPNTYQNLLENGIKADYSMGFADQVGFRNGTANPFPWFDLSKNEISDLTIYPFAYMDGTLNEYLKLTTEEAKSKIAELYKEVEQYGGQFSFIWHNETITDYKIWKGWSEVLDFTLNLKK